VRHRRHERHGLGDPVVDVLHYTVTVRRTPLVASQVLEDRDEPGAAIGARRVAVEGTQRLEERVLHQVLGLLAVPLEPHREPEEAIEMRQRLRFEGRPRFLAGCGGPFRHAMREASAP
jgi:hypothetical protein